MEAQTRVHVPLVAAVTSCTPQPFPPPPPLVLYLLSLYSEASSTKVIFLQSSLFYSRKLHSQSVVFGAELIRSLHGYQVSEEEEEWVEREFLFSPSSCIEMRDPIPGPIMVASTAGDGGNGFRYRFKEGQSVGLWRCILAFDSTVAFSASSSPIPPLLCLSR